MVRGDALVLKELEVEWLKVSLQTGWKLEHALTGTPSCQNWSTLFLSVMAECVPKRTLPI